MTLNDCRICARTLLPRLATVCWARRQAVLQKENAAGAEKRRWGLVIIILDEQIQEQERMITQQMSVLKFKVKGEVF